MTCVTDGAGGTSCSSVEVGTPAQVLSKTENFVTQWKSACTSVLLEQVPPAPSVTHVMVWAEYGYSANLRLEDFASASAMFVTHRDGEPLSADHGAPLRLVVPHLYAWKGPKWVRGLEYLLRERRGFWEERGYHNLADPWQEQRWSYQEEPGDGP